MADVIEVLINSSALIYNTTYDGYVLKLEKENFIIYDDDYKYTEVFFSADDIKQWGVNYTTTNSGNSTSNTKTYKYNGETISQLSNTANKYIGSLNKQSELKGIGDESKKDNIFIVASTSSLRGYITKKEEEKEDTSSETLNYIINKADVQTRDGTLIKKQEYLFTNFDELGDNWPYYIIDPSIYSIIKISTSSKVTYYDINKESTIKDFMSDNSITDIKINQSALMQKKTSCFKSKNGLFLKDTCIIPIDAPESEHFIKSLDSNTKIRWKDKSYLNGYEGKAQVTERLEGNDTKIYYDSDSNFWKYFGWNYGRYPIVLWDTSRAYDIPIFKFEDSKLYVSALSADNKQTDVLTVQLYPDDIIDYTSATSDEWDISNPRFSGTRKLLTDTSFFVKERGTDSNFSFDIFQNFQSLTQSFGKNIVEASKIKDGTYKGFSIFKNNTSSSEFTGNLPLIMKTYTTQFKQRYAFESSVEEDEEYYLTKQNQGVSYTYNVNAQNFTRPINKTYSEQTEELYGLFDSENDYEINFIYEKTANTISITSLFLELYCLDFKSPFIATANSEDSTASNFTSPLKQESGYEPKLSENFYLFGREADKEENQLGWKVLERVDPDLNGQYDRYYLAPPTTDLTNNIYVWNKNTNDHKLLTGVYDRKIIERINSSYQVTYDFVNRYIKGYYGNSITGSDLQGWLQGLCISKNKLSYDEVSVEAGTVILWTTHYPGDIDYINGTITTEDKTIDRSSIIENAISTSDSAYTGWDSITLTNNNNFDVILTQYTFTDGYHMTDYKYTIKANSSVNIENPLDTQEHSVDYCWKIEAEGYQPLYSTKYDYYKNLIS